MPHAQTPCAALSTDTVSASLPIHANLHIPQCTKSITSGDRDFDKHKRISAGMQKLIITCAKSKLAKQADEELKFGLSAIGSEARQMLVAKPASELQTVMTEEQELRQAMLKREKQMKAAEHLIQKHQRLVAEMATSHATRAWGGEGGGHEKAAVAKSQDANRARSWLERARQASDLSAQEALKTMTPAQLRKKLASIEGLLRRGVKDGLVQPQAQGGSEPRKLAAGAGPVGMAELSQVSSAILPGRKESATASTKTSAHASRAASGALESGGKEIMIASALDVAARRAVKSMNKTNQALTASLARRVQVLTREEARGLRQEHQAELEEKQVLPQGLSRALQMRRRDDTEAARLQRLRSAELQAEADEDKMP
jgi:hypothetical protein